MLSIFQTYFIRSFVFRLDEHCDDQTGPGDGGEPEGRAPGPRGLHSARCAAIVRQQVGFSLTIVVDPDLVGSASFRRSRIQEGNKKLWEIHIKIDQKYCNICWNRTRIRYLRIRIQIKKLIHNNAITSIKVFNSLQMKLWIG